MSSDLLDPEKATTEFISVTYNQMVAYDDVVQLGGSIEHEFFRADQTKS